LSISHEVGRYQKTKDNKHSKGKESYKDKNKRDRLKEKELILKAKRNKLVDRDDSLDTMAMIFSSKWHQPSRLSQDSDIQPIQVNSQETAVQTKRMSLVMPVNYLSEDEVRSDPFPMTEDEQTMDRNTQMASVPKTIPFFYQQVPVPIPVPLPAPVTTAIPTIPPPPPPPPPPLMQPVLPPPSLPAPAVLPPPTVATLNTVRSMGLPDFLAGQNIQALQALVTSPDLLRTFVDVNGNYDQVRIMTLIHAMNQQLQKTSVGVAGPYAPPPPPPSIPPPAQPNYSHYGAAQMPQQYTIPQSTYHTQTQTPTNTNGYRGVQNSTDGNLHLSGYGPNTSIEAIVNMFAPYVKVDEVVPKNSFMFLNTSDPEGANRAREALNGVMIGGAPLKINSALRRTKNPASAPSSSMTSQGSTAQLPRNALGQVDYDAVRDEKGNPATRNLFVAGYGASTTEQQLRDVFGQHTQVTGVVMKGTFSFVNTLEKTSAVQARHALIGTFVNGGPLRINFAKESGRLGTSFDVAAAAKKSAMNFSHYGHSYQ
jgi:hypothetical protein